jgi:hypothetical protein
MHRFTSYVYETILRKNRFYLIISETVKLIFLGCKIRLSVFSTTFLRNVLRAEKYLSSYARVTFEMHPETRVGLYVKCPLLLSNFTPNWHIWTTFRKTTNC